jgi:hypothetical protein
VRVRRCDQTAKQRTLSARSHRDVGSCGNLHHAQGVGQRQLQRDIARDRGDAFDLQFGRTHGQQKGERIVHTGIGVDDDAERAAAGFRIERVASRWHDFCRAGQSR